MLIGWHVTKQRIKMKLHEIVKLDPVAGDDIKMIAPPKQDKLDTLIFDIPTIIKLLEWARENAKTDEIMHHVIEKLSSFREETITMDILEKVLKK